MKAYYHYLRKENRKPYAVFCAIINLGEPILYGWSLCNKKDKFIKAFGREIAFYRALNYKMKVPQSIINDFQTFKFVTRGRD